MYQYQFRSLLPSNPSLLRYSLAPCVCYSRCSPPPLSLFPSAALRSRCCYDYYQRHHSPVAIHYPRSSLLTAVNVLTSRLLQRLLILPSLYHCLQKHSSYLVLMVLLSSPLSLAASDAFLQDRLFRQVDSRVFIVLSVGHHSKHSSFFLSFSFPFSRKITLPRVPPVFLSSTVLLCRNFHQFPAFFAVYRRATPRRLHSRTGSHLPQFYN